MAKSNLIKVQGASGSDPYDEATLRLEYARKIASYIAAVEGDPDEESNVVPHIVGSVVGAVELLIADAEELFSQASDKQREEMLKSKGPLPQAG